MKTIKRITIFCAAAIAAIACSVSAMAVTTRTMEGMHASETENVEFLEEITDSYGNSHSTNVLGFDARQRGYVKYELKGEYSVFRASLLAANTTSTDANMRFAIFADGKEVYSISGFTKQLDAQKIEIDLTGVNVLELMSLDRDREWNAWLYIVDGIFTVAEQVPDTYQEWVKLSDLVVVDSEDYASGYLLAEDSYGELYNSGHAFDSRNDGYSLFNLNKSYETFSGYIYPQQNADDEMDATVNIYADNTLVYTKAGIINTTEAIPFALDVKDVKTLKIETSSTSSRWSQDVYIAGSKLSKHQHIPDEWVIEKEATCVENGSQSRYCIECGLAAMTEIIPAMGHTSDGKWVITKETTCNVKGEEVQHCTVCNEIAKTRAIDKLAHTTGKKWELTSEPTCTKEGLQVKICEVCGEVAEKEKLPVVDHAYGRWTKLSGSIWNNPIIKERTCSVCGNIEKNESSPTAWLKPLVTIILLAGLVGLVMFGRNVKKKGLTLEASNVKRLFSKETLSDDDIESILKRPKSK